MAWNLPHTGQLRYSFRFDRATAGDGGMTNIGGVIGGFAPGTTWTPLINQRSVKLEPLAGGHEVVAERLSGKAIFNLWVRFDSLASTLRDGDRGVDLASGLVYALGLPIDPNYRRQWLLIQATATGRSG